MRIDLEDVSCRYEDKEALFSGVDLRLQSGEFVLLEGPSGSGKTSFLRLLNLLAAPATGRVLFDGEAPRPEKVSALRRRVMLVPQTPVMRPGSVEENLTYAFGFKAARGAARPGREQLRQGLDEVLLDDVPLDEEAGDLSVGQQQRVALLRALLAGPEFLLLDEPTAALDGKARKAVDGLIEKRCQEDGVGVVMVSHQEFSPQQVKVRRLSLGRDGLAEGAA